MQTFQTNIVQPKSINATNIYQISDFSLCISTFSDFIYKTNMPEHISAYFGEYNITCSFSVVLQYI